MSGKEEKVQEPATKTEPCDHPWEQLTIGQGGLVCGKCGSSWYAEQAALVVHQAAQAKLASLEARIAALEKKPPISPAPPVKE